MVYKIESTSNKDESSYLLYTEADVFNIFEAIKRNIAMCKPEQSDITKNDCLLIIDANYCLLNATSD